MSHRLRVRPARRLADCERVTALHATIWGNAELAPPASMLRTIADAGGIVLLAEMAHEPVGFCYGFPGQGRRGERYHRSHAAGVLPRLRDQGIGWQLKQAQRRAALRQGLDRMIWTFDPLQTRNANFNLDRLGACARGYHRDYYGARQDAFNGGLPTDRLVVDWFLAGPAAAARRQVAALDLPAPVPVPPDLRRQVETDPAGARRQHRRLRRQLEAGLAAGLAVVSFDRAAGRYRFGRLPDSVPPPV
ncbi:MAG TPA: GNAT family N-acetyltransferase [Candidatus Dormibacteraeota bacterium]|nr:GNAT family N-acetyltransferase [Candidatus Dormibacteraeota bacterium]